MGIRTPVSNNYAITLGGLKTGVTPLDMAHAYQTLATGGLLVTGTLGAGDRGPVGIRRVGLRDNRSRIRDENDRRRRRVLPKGVAQETTHLLESVIKDGTARAAQLGSVRAWGKTGTTENYGDAWFVGATDKLTVAVWVGYPDELRPMRTEYRGEPVSGGTYPAQIWHEFMLGVLDTDKRRLERECAKEQAAKERAAAKEAAKADSAGTGTTTSAPAAVQPSKHCLQAGLAPDPTAQATPSTSAGAGAGAGTSTTPNPGSAATAGTGHSSRGDTTANDGGTPAAPPAAPAAPAPPATGQPAPAAPAPSAESGGVTPPP
jgi:penicillin-binding protein 1A